MEFVFEADGAAACAKIVRAMSDKSVRELLGEDKHRAWDAAKDDYERMVLSRDAEILDVLLKFYASPVCFANQAKLEAALAKDGVARINCGSCDSELTDETGAKWLPDQRDTGFRAYGYKNASFVARGNIEIHKTDHPSIYRTEASDERNKIMTYSLSSCLSPLEMPFSLNILLYLLMH